MQDEDADDRRASTGLDAELRARLEELLRECVAPQRPCVRMSRVAVLRTADGCEYPWPPEVEYQTAQPADAARVKAMLETLGNLMLCAPREIRERLGCDPVANGARLAAELAVLAFGHIDFALEVGPGDEFVVFDEDGTFKFNPGEGESEIEIVPDALEATARLLRTILGEVDAPRELRVPHGSDWMALRLLWSTSGRADASTTPASELVDRLRLGGERSVRRVLDRLRDAEWPIESVRGATGGYRLDRRRLSVAQRNWLEEEFPVDRT